LPACSTANGGGATGAADNGGSGDTRGGETPTASLPRVHENRRQDRSTTAQKQRMKQVYN